MGDVNKITKSVTLDPKLVDYVNELVEQNCTTFSDEVKKSINLKKATEAGKPYSYADELEDIPMSSPKGRSAGWWSRTAAIGIYRLLEYFQQRDMDAAAEVEQ
ncbi:MAG TPA: hypothetical protein DCX03_01615 [Bacteroidales bacterium]|nr:hypothetical protein [Bacteroidales bacterium]